MRKNKLFIVAMAATAVIACTSNKNMDNHAGIKPENLDTTAVAGNDFYQYACGGWMATHPLTP